MADDAWVMGTFGRQFGLQQQLLAPVRPSGKSFFLTQLLHGVIFPEAPIAGTNLKYERRRTRIKWGAAVGSTAVAALAFAGWTTSYLGNRQYVDTVAARALQWIGFGCVVLLVVDSLLLVGALSVRERAQSGPSETAEIEHRPDIPLIRSDGLMQVSNFG